MFPYKREKFGIFDSLKKIFMGELYTGILRYLYIIRSVPSSAGHSTRNSELIRPDRPRMQKRGEIYKLYSLTNKKKKYIMNFENKTLYQLLEENGIKLPTDNPKNMNYIGVLHTMDLNVKEIYKIVNNDNIDDIEKQKKLSNLKI